MAAMGHNYLSFVQNILGRLRTMAITIVTLFLAATIASSTYPFDCKRVWALRLAWLWSAT